MKLVKNLAFNIFLLLCFFSFSISAQEVVKENIQINLEGKDLSRFTIEVDGNNILINGKSPEQSGVKVNIIRQRSGTDIRNITEYGLDAKPEAKTRAAVVPSQRMLGIVTKEIKNGVQIIEVKNDGAARKAGMKIGDVIKMVDGQKVQRNIDLADYIKSRNPGESIILTFMRRNNKLSTEIILGSSSVKYTSTKADKVRNERTSSVRPVSLGIKLREDSKGDEWIVIEVNKNSMAENAGVKVNDILIDINGIVIKTAEDVERAMLTTQNDAPISIKVKRAGNILDLEIN